MKIASEVLKLQSAVSADLDRPSMCGVNLEDGLAVATDGRILAIRRIAHEDAIRDEPFPGWRNVVPEPRREFIVRLDAALLYRLAEAIVDDEFGLLQVSLAIAEDDPKAPIVVHGNAGSGVIMPCEVRAHASDPTAALRRLIGADKEKEELPDQAA